MHALRELLFDFPQLRPHALADRPALYGEVPVPVTILNQIYEEDFLGFSYGFRPGRCFAHTRQPL